MRSMISRSLNVPGSLSSPLATTYLSNSGGLASASTGRAASSSAGERWPHTSSHFWYIGAPAPPIPPRRDSFSRHIQG